MKSLEEFQSFYQSDLTKTLNELELERKRAVKLVPLVVLGIIGLIGGVVGFMSGIMPLLFIILAIASLVITIICIVKIVGIKKPMKAKYKEEVIREMIGFLSEDLNYSPSGFISEGEFKRSKIFLKSADRYTGDDLVEGNLGETSVRFSELKTEYYTTNSKGNRTYHILFKGIFFIADFNKHFIGETMVLVDTAESMFGKLGTMLQKMNVSRPKLVKLEDPTFEKEFAVYGTDQVEARYILTPAMMSRIVDFKKKTGKVSLSFLNSNVYIAIDVSKNLFEPPFYKSMLDFELVKEYFNYLVLCVDIVEDLDLNTRIWTKD
ncbi:MAG: DUF3137 domain-containing protein [Crocinitomicaceae bacterium]|nr:DUF3137 domain-containing protein [Crocinitomicaceae bacterium]